MFRPLQGPAPVTHFFPEAMQLIRRHLFRPSACLTFVLRHGHVACPHPSRPEKRERSGAGTRPGGVAGRRLMLAAAACWTAAISAPLAAADARLPDFLTITQLDAAAVREIVSQQAAKPSLATAAPWSHAWQDAVLLRAGATREELARLRLDLEAACGRERRGMDVREFLSLTRQPEWRRMANRVADCLHLPAVTRLTPEVAAQLARHRGAIALAGLTEIDGATSAAIAAAPGPLDLGGLTSLSPEVAAALAAHAGPLHLGGLESLTPEAARELAAYRGAWLDVSGLTSLSAEAARALANCTGRWNGRLPSLRTLSAEAADELARSRMPLDLRGLRALTPDAAEALAREAVAFNLDGLTTLEPGVAGKLAEFQGPLSVAGLADISPAVAESLVRCRTWDGRLPQLESLSPAVAGILATRRGNLTLSGLAAIAEESARAIAARPGGGLWLDGLEALPPEVARAIRSPVPAADRQARPGRAATKARHPAAATRMAGGGAWRLALTAGRMIAATKPGP